MKKNNLKVVKPLWPNCTPTELRVLITELKRGIRQCKKEKEMVKKSWGYQNGVLISGDDALIFLKMCEALKHNITFPSDDNVISIAYNAAQNLRNSGFKV